MNKITVEAAPTHTHTHWNFWLVLMILGESFDFDFGHAMATATALLLTSLRWFFLRRCRLGRSMWLRRPLSSIETMLKMSKTFNLIYSKSSLCRRRFRCHALLLLPSLLRLLLLHKLQNALVHVANLQQREWGREWEGKREQVAGRKPMIGDKWAPSGDWWNCCSLPAACLALVQRKWKRKCKSKLKKNLCFHLSLSLSVFSTLLLSRRGLLSRDAANDKSKSHSNATRRAAEVNAKNFCPTISHPSPSPSRYH